MIAIDKNQLDIVKGILKKHVPNYGIWAFGSRVDQSPKKYSDLDLVIKTKQPLPPEMMFHLRDAFSESNLLFRVDVVDWSKISDQFQKIIREKYEIIQNAPKTQKQI